MSMFLRTGAAMAAAGLVSFASAQPVYNGGFEIAGDDAADAAGWSEFSGGTGSLSIRDAANPASGEWALRFLAVGGPGIGGAAGATYNSSAFFASLQEQTTVSLTFDANVDLGPGGVAFYALRVVNSAGGVVADTGLQGIGATGGSYQSFTSAELTVPSFAGEPNDEYFVFLEFVVNAGAFDGSTAGMYLDNVVVDATLVPAPGAAMLLGLGGLAAARRRR